MNKQAAYVQTGPATTAPQATEPFQFSAGVDGGTATNPAPPNTLVLPNNAGTRTLTFGGEGGGQGWQIEQSFATQAAMDAAFPNGTYVLNLGGRATSVPLTGDLYPNVPVATITGGTWSNGVLMLDRASPVTVTINFTQNYLAGRSRLGIYIDASSGQGTDLGTENDFTASTLTLTVPANSLSAGGVYQLNMEANRAITFDTTSVPGATVIGAYSNRVQVTINVSGPPAPPTFTQQPSPQNVAAGSTVVFTAFANNATSYQWRRDGVNFGSPQGPTLVLSGASVVSGDYSVVASNATGSATSNTARLSTFVTSDFGRLINLSILSSIPTTGDSFTLGYVVGGTGTTGAKPLVLRAAGPSLAAFGVAGTLNDPKIELFAGSTPTGGNDNWGGTTVLSTAFVGVGAFPYLSTTSLDAAAVANITTRDNSVKVSAAGSGTGTVIAEVYDATPAGTSTATTPRLLNVSVLKTIDAGTSLTAGFVLRGQTARTVLIRAIGPGLAAFGLTGMTDPQLTLFAGTSQIGGNDNWGGNAAISATASAIGAFAITDSNSRDAMLLRTLGTGDYSVRVSGAGSAGGLVIVEIYEVP